MSEVSTKCRQLKLKAKDGIMRKIDTLDTEANLDNNKLLEIHPDKQIETPKMWYNLVVRSTYEKYN